MSEVAAPKLWQLDVERVARALREAGPDEQRLALDRLAKRHGQEARAEAAAKLAPKPVGPKVPAEALAEIKTNSDARAQEQLRADAKFKKEEQAKPADAPPVLNPRAPMDIASVFIQRECVVDGHCIQWYWQGQFYRWSGRIYEATGEEPMKAQLWHFLNDARKRSGDQEVRFQPEQRNVNEVYAALKSLVALPNECKAPMWLDTRKPATEWVVFKNRVLNVLTEDEMPLTPNLWVNSALGFDWNAEAECPVWMEFLGEVFPDDPESVDTVEQWMGYCMTDETRFQKGMMFIGEKRSGKGTIAHVIEHLVGAPNYVGLSFSNWVRGENSRQSLIGKRVGVFPDVRLAKGRAFGKNYDPGGLSYGSAELLLNIIGEDSITISRKYLDDWRGQLQIKLTLISNEVPNLNDPGGVLPSRFIKLRFPVTFFGREDPDLRSKLRAELSGIAVRCVRAYGDLCAQGRFVQPQSSRVLELDVLAASDPFTAMALECFEVDHSAMVVKTKAYALFTSWCVRNGREDILRSVSDKKFGERLKAVDGFGHVVGWRQTGSSPRVWLGLRLKAKKKDDDE